MAISAKRPLSAEDRIIWEARLAEAQTAYHDLATGTAVAAFTDQNGERVSYSKAKLSDLSGYINDMIALLGTPATVFTSSAPRPLRYLFGR